MKEIPLTRGYVALVDDEDFERASQYKWHAQAGRNTTYASRDVTINGAKKSVYLHRFVLSVPAGVAVDHIDRNGLNCQKYNLRSCSNSQNSYNQGVSPKNTSGYRGVSWNKRLGKWHAYVSAKGKRRHVGFYDTPEDAAGMRDVYAGALHGKFAYLNFPD